MTCICHDQTVGQYDDDDFEIGVAGEPGAAQVDCYFPAGDSCPVLAAIGAVEGGRVYEIDLHGAALGDVVGLSILVNDADGLGREGWLEWTPGVGYTKDPSLFGDVILLAKGATVPESGEKTGPSDTWNAGFGDAGAGVGSGSVPHATDGECEAGGPRPAGQWPGALVGLLLLLGWLWIRRGRIPLSFYAG